MLKQNLCPTYQVLQAGRRNSILPLEKSSSHLFSDPDLLPDVLDPDLEDFLLLSDVSPASDSCSE